VKDALSDPFLTPQRSPVATGTTRGCWRMAKRDVGGAPRSACGG